MELLWTQSEEAVFLERRNIVVGWFQNFKDQLKSELSIHIKCVKINFRDIWFYALNCSNVQGMIYSQV